jgi:uncharacterized membrane protein YvlD (DUF360 family)
VSYHKICNLLGLKPFQFNHLLEATMLGFFLTTLVTALSLLIVDLVVPGVDIASFPVALLAGVAIGVVNAFIKPILSILSLPRDLQENTLPIK